MELKPCPYCSGEAIIADVNYLDKSFHILCEECPAEMNLSFADAGIGTGDIVSFYEMQKIMNELVEAWNRRHNDD